MSKQLTDEEILKKPDLLDIFVEIQIRAITPKQATDKIHALYTKHFKEVVGKEEKQQIEDGVCQTCYEDVIDGECWCTIRNQFRKELLERWGK